MIASEKHIVRFYLGHHLKYFITFVQLAQFHGHPSFWGQPGGKNHQKCPKTWVLPLILEFDHYFLTK